MTPKPLTLGSYARDVMAVEDIVNICRALLKTHAPAKAARFETAKPSLTVAHRLFVALNTLVPPFSYWGHHPSDVSHLGVWIDLGKLHDAEESGKLVQAGYRDAKGVKAVYVLVPESDGLVLYHRKSGREVWRTT